MKNLVLKALLVLSISMVSISCSSDDAPAPAASIIGKWEFLKETIGGNLVDYGHTDGCNKDRLEITATTYTDVFYESAPGGIPCDEIIDPSPYTKAGNVLTVIHPTEETYTVKILSVSATELKTEEGAGFIYVYKRI